MDNLSGRDSEVFTGDEAAVLEAVYARSAQIRGRHRSVTFGVAGFAAGVAVTVSVIFGLFTVTGGGGTTGLRLVEPAGAPAPTVPPGRPGRLLWRSGALGAVGTLPAYGEGRLFVAAADRTVYALDAATGTVVWSHTLCCTPPTSAVPPTVDYAGGRVIVAAADAPLQALDARNGQPAWTTAGADPALTDGGVAVAGQVVVSAGPSGIHAYRVTTGDLIWAVRGVAGRLAAPNARSVFVVVSGGGGTGDQLWDLDLANGRMRWRRPLGAAVHGRFSASQDTVYVLDDEGGLHAVGTADGHDRWTASVAPADCGTQLSCPSDPGGFRSQPNITAGLVTVGDDAGVITAFDARDGSRRWQRVTGAPVRASPNVAGGVVYITNDASTLFALDLITGATGWSADTLAAVRSMSTVVRGAIYVADTAGHVTAFAA